MKRCRAVAVLLVWFAASAATAAAADTHALWQARGAGGQACLDITSKLREATSLIDRAEWIFFRPDAGDLFWAAVELGVMADRARTAASDLRRLGEASDATRADECAMEADSAAKAAIAASKALNGSSPED